MIPQPTSHFGGKTQTISVTPPPTASLLAYYDAALTASYVSGSTVLYDLSGNGYHMTASNQSSPFFEITPSPKPSLYGYSPCFNNYYGTWQRQNSDLADAFNPTSSGWLSYTASLCGGSPQYLDGVDYTVVTYCLCSGQSGEYGALNQIGTKFYYQYGPVFGAADFMQARLYYGKTNPLGTVTQTPNWVFSYSQLPLANVGGQTTAFLNWMLTAVTKTCSGSFVSGSQTYYRNNNTQYIFPSSYSSSLLSVDTQYAPLSGSASGSAANNILIYNETGSDPRWTSWGNYWSGATQAMLIYNKVLTPAELSSIAAYFNFRNLPTP